MAEDRSATGKHVPKMLQSASVTRRGKRFNCMSVLSSSSIEVRSANVASAISLESKRKALGHCQRDWMTRGYRTSADATCSAR